VAFAQQPPPASVAKTPDEARAAALAAVPGTALEVELEIVGGRAAYKVKVLPSSGGPEVTVWVDASTGAVLSRVADDADLPGDAPERDDASEVEMQPSSGGPVVEARVDAPTGAMPSRVGDDEDRPERDDADLPGGAPERDDAD
jgi:hypothetical protein